MSETVVSVLRAMGQIAAREFETIRAHIETNLCDSQNGYCEYCSQHPDNNPADAARTYLDEMVCEIVLRVGTPVALLLSYGGPTVEIVWDTRLGNWSAYWRATWNCEPVTDHSEVFQWVINQFVEEGDLYA